MCKCIDLANKELASRNCRIATKLMFNFKTGKSWEAIPVPLEKINSSVRKPLGTLLCTFCPICGKRCSTATKTKRKAKV